MERSIDLGKRMIQSAKAKTKKGARGSKTTRSMILSAKSGEMSSRCNGREGERQVSAQAGPVNTQGRAGGSGTGLRRHVRLEERPITKVCVCVWYTFMFS